MSFCHLQAKLWAQGETNALCLCFSRLIILRTFFPILKMYILRPLALPALQSDLPKVLWFLYDTYHPSSYFFFFFLSCGN